MGKNTWLFYFDPPCITPLNIVIKDMKEFVVEQVVCHDFLYFNDKKWMVQWFGTETLDETCENYELKDVEAFHHY